MAKPNTRETTIDIITVTQDSVTFRVLGTSPLVLNTMSQKVKRGLLLPSKKNAAEKQSTLKHNPPEEFLGSIFHSMDDNSPTRILFKSVAFKAAMSDTAKDLPGSSKAQVGRLTYVQGDTVPIFGVPEIFLDVVRSADMNRTPDIRTRAILPEWATQVTLTYVTPILKEATVSKLLAAAGIMRGVGDGRPEKGKLAFGTFKLVSADDADWKRIVKEGGRKAQVSPRSAIRSPTTPSRSSFSSGGRLRRSSADSRCAVRLHKRGGHDQRAEGGT